MYFFQIIYGLLFFVVFVVIYTVFIIYVHAMHTVWNSQGAVPDILVSIMSKLFLMCVFHICVFVFSISCIIYF